MPGLGFLRDELAALEQGGRMRALRTRDGGQGPKIRLDGKSVVNFSSNDYLGLAGHRLLSQAASTASLEYGAGAGASRLIVGNHRGHDELEAQIAAFHGREAALLFNSGYNANVGALQALIGPGDVVLSDELNHASIIDGCRLSRAEVAVFRHCDVDHLRELLRARRRLSRRCLIVSDTVFSMDGDTAPLRALADLAAEFEAMLMVDEAHATGVLGPGGRGYAAEVGVAADVHMGTLGKGLGSFGAYVTGSRELIQWLLNRSRSFVFTTALPAGVIAASAAALTLCVGSDGDNRRAALRRKGMRFRDGLQRLGLGVPSGSTPVIFPVLVGGEREAMACCEALLASGFYAQGIRPPTVPRGTSRLRFSVMATHTESDIDGALAALSQLVSDRSIPTV